MTNKTEIIQKNSIAQKIIGEHESRKQEVSIHEDYAPEPNPDIDD